MLAFCFALGSLAVAQKGLVQEHYPDGRLKTSKYTVEAREYVFTYHPSGKLSSTAEYLEGRRDGFWKVYDEEGRLIMHACFDQGRRCGTWEFFASNGALRGRLSFIEGDLAQGEAYGTDGGLLATRDY